MIFAYDSVSVLAAERIHGLKEILRNITYTFQQNGDQRSLQTVSDESYVQLLERNAEHYLMTNR